MSKLAKYLINKEKKQKTKFLDLGNCGITDLAADIPELFELEWLETLVLSNGYEDLRTQKEQESANAEMPNSISVLPAELKSLTNLKALYLGSFEVIQESAAYWYIQAFEIALDGLEVIQHFKQLEILDCRYRMITSIEFLKDLSKLQYLKLNDNQISDLQFLDGLVELKALALNNNSIEQITRVYNLPKLEQLNLSNNKLSDVGGLATFDALKFLDVSNNRIINLKGIQNLFALEDLNLSNNQLDRVFRLANLVALKKLNLNQIRLYDFYSLQKLSNLKELNLSQTGIRELELIMNFSKLESLELEGNEIEDIQLIPKLINLKSLNLARNTIVDIMPLVPLMQKGLEIISMDDDYYGTDAALNLTKDFTINLYKNPIQSPPVEIVAQGTQAILNFLAEGQVTEITSDDFYEVKILIIGQGGAGKTTLFRKLRNPNSQLPSEKESTMGIEIHQLNFKTRHDKNVRANIWDFGGQEIYHSTHQFFFSKRALYILVDDTRINNDTSVNDKSFAYWFGLVDLLGGDSPLLIVQNEKNDRSKPLEINSMRGRFGFVKEVLRTNLESGRGLSEVHNAIENQVQNLLNTNVSLPISWIDIRKEINILAKEKHKIAESEWQTICKQHGIEDPKRQKSLSQYFHDIGVFLHFQDNSLLRKSVILQKEWATTAIYRVLDDETIKDHAGQFEETDLKRLWKKDNLSNYRDEFLALMLKFELCFELPDRPEKRWLAPQLLSKKQPDYDWSGEQNKELHFKYDFLPSGLMNRLIVRLNRFIVRTDLAWRSGVVLERLGAQAEVMEISEETIRIRVKGDDPNFRKELLIIIIDEFDQLHKKLRGLKLSKWVACTCKACSLSEAPELFKYASLLSRKKDGKTTIECNNSYESISVNELLDESKAVLVNKKRLNKKEKLKLLIANNKTAKVFEQLKKERPEDDLVIAVESQWRSLRTKEISGVISFENTTIIRNRITQSLLELVQGLENSKK